MMRSTSNGLRRGQVTALFASKRDSLRRAYPDNDGDENARGPGDSDGDEAAPAPASAAAAPPQPADVEDAPSLRRFRPSMMKR